MILRKILFWLIWIPMLPVIYVFCGGGRTYNTSYVQFKIGWVRRVVWDKVVLRKPGTRRKYRQYDPTRRF